MSTNQIRDEGDPRKYFIQVPNMVDDLGLSVYAVRLYMHLKRVAGENGTCYKSTRNLAEHCQMSIMQVSRVKRELAKAGLITIQTRKSEHGGRDYHEITIRDIWASNSQLYQVPDRYLQVPVVELASTCGDTQEEPIKNNNTSVVVSDKYSPAQSLFLAAFGAKRFATIIQMETIRELEEKYGYKRVEDLIKWAAKQGMTLGRAVISIESALKKKPKSNSEQKQITMNEDGSLYV